MLPLSWGGADVDANKVRICPNTHYGTHALLNEYVHHGGTPPPTVLIGFTRVAQWLAAYAWDHRPPGHPTPFWAPAHVHP